jgi:primary-amine oxidase
MPPRDVLAPASPDNWSDGWMRVLWDARLAELFVPYHSGSPRYYDLTGFGFPLVDATQDDAGCCGEVLEGKVVKEVRDRGVAWKDDAAVHRGQTLVLWATLDAANYNYIIEYGFSDDGAISYRLGATARNLPSKVWEAHMHNGLWRIDIDLDGFPNDSAMLMRHVEPTSGNTATDPSQPFGGGIEGAAEWNDLEFTHLHIGDSVTTNKHGHHIGYDLMPIRHGTARHSEAFTQHDFWVTRYHPTELLYPLVPPTFIDYRNGESVTDTDVVLWHISSAHHLPRDEDGEMVGDVWQGSALVMWYGFDMRPRDLFDNTPLHP